MNDVYVHSKSAIDDVSNYVSINDRFDCSFSILVSLGKNLLLESVWLGETKSDLVGGELMVAVHNGIKLVLHSILIEWVHHDLLVLSTVKGNSDGFSGNVRWEALYS